MYDNLILWSKKREREFIGKYSEDLELMTAFIQMKKFFLRGVVITIFLFIITIIIMPYFAR